MVKFFRSKHTASDSIIEFYVLQGTFQLSRGNHGIEHKHEDDNEDTIEDDDPETNVRKFVGVTDIVKIVREKKSVLDFIDENKSWQPGMILMMYGTYKVELVKNVKKNIFDLIERS